MSALRPALLDHLVSAHQKRFRNFQPERLGGPEIDEAFARIVDDHMQALIIFSDGLTVAHEKKLADLAFANKLPAMFGFREFTELGGLASYGSSLPEMWRRAAWYVDKILKGVSPGDIPIEQPTRFELVVNLKTAKALGLEIPPTLLARADEVIE